MDSSSDGSFAWTDASDDSTDKKMSKSKNSSQSGDESESGKTYKKRLQQRLFSDGHDEANNMGSPPQKKRKVSQVQTHSDVDSTKSPKKKRIKTEPESDVDVRKLNKKHKCSETNMSISNDSYDEEFLNSKVKDEQMFATPAARKKKKSIKTNVSEVKDISLNNGDVSQARDSSSCESQEKSGFNIQIHYEDESSHLEEDESSMNTSKKKKKKSKRKKEKSDSEASGKDTSNRESLCAENSVVHHEELPQNHHSHKSTPRNVEEIIRNGNVTPRDESRKDSTSVTDKDKSKASISERITYEDEDSDVHTRTETTKTTLVKKSIKLKNFVESKTALQPFLKNLPKALVLTDDDDVWMIQCPKDVIVDTFQDKKWVLENKCKIKLGDQTYEGNVSDERRNLTIVNTVNDNTMIKNIAIKGCIRLRRRIPKAHVQEDNIMVNNQSNFIPLPETKCRHPLFGLNYKKAIKLPSSVRERLQAAHDHKSSLSKEKSKKKKDKRKSEKIEEVLSTPKYEPTADKYGELTELSQITSKKKKKKRKHSGTVDDSEPPRQKKFKHDPESVEAWDSEKAIEENLFNF